MRFIKLVFSAWLISHVIQVSAIGNDQANVLTLAGTWQFAMDTASVGENEKWYTNQLPDQVVLPGTTDLNKKSHTAGYSCNCLVNAMGKPAHKHCSPYTDTTSYHFTRLYPFTGKAWYRKEIEVPASFRGKIVYLKLERTKVTKVWINNQFVGRSDLLSAAQVFDITRFLSTGKQTITIQVDNNPKLVKTGFSHSYSYDTQTNWNGILGEMSLTALPVCHVTHADVYPDPASKSVLVKLKVSNKANKNTHLKFRLQARNEIGIKGEDISPLSYAARITSTDTVLAIRYPMGTNPLLWSEFNPHLYQLEVQVNTGRKSMQKIVQSFGMREFKTRDSQFTINGATTFLRGKNDGCVFPLTGHTPTDTASWMRYLRITKDYGMNHVRFHSWCPPKAAFEAADRLGMYLQVELPYWGSYSAKDTALINYMTNEGIQMLNQYGNHPSFCMLSLGNELNGDQKVMDEITRHLKMYDSRHLYSYGTNSNFSNPAPGEYDDFWVTGWTGKEKHKNHAYHVRSAFATNEDETGGLSNALKPSTQRNYSQAIRDYNIPVLGHEIGQYQVYPDFNEIEKYTGVLKPYNYEVFRRRLAKAGMAHQAGDFFRSTGQSCSILYREEYEAALRTPGFGGFQVLDLQDYPGQVTALVGILDPFMDSKGIITPQKFREFCSEVVPLVVMPAYCYSNREVLVAQVKIANYSLTDFSNAQLSWKLVNSENRVHTQGSLSMSKVQQGGLYELDSLKLDLQKFTRSEKLTLMVEIDGTEYRNEYPVWVYPSELSIEKPGNVQIINSLNAESLEAVSKGGVFLMFPDHKGIESKSVAPQFINEFWSWYMFKGICESNKRPVSAGTLGLLVNTSHPVFQYFPTEFHSNWQWWNIMKTSRPLILDQFPAGLKPIVQVINNIDRNHKLGSLFEFTVGKARVLVCMTNLASVLDEPEVRAYYSGILKYVASDRFAPEVDLGFDEVKKLLLQE